MMKRILIGLLFVVTGCIPTKSSMIMVSGIDEPSLAITRVDGIVRGLDFYPVESAPSAEKADTIVKVYHTALSSGIFIVVRFEPPWRSIDVHFFEGGESFSPLGLQKRDQLVDQIAVAFGRDNLTMK